MNPLRIRRLFAWLVLVAAPFAAVLAAPLPCRADLLVSDNFGHQVLRYDQNTGAFLGTLVPAGSGGLNGATGLLIANDGHLLVSSQNSNQILKYALPTGAFQGVFSSAPGLLGPADLLTAPDGRLLVTNFGGASVEAVNATTGAAEGAFASGGGLAAASYGVIGPDNNLYVSSFATNQVLRYNGATGAFIDAFASGGGLNGPTGLAFNNGDLFVASLLGQQILRFNGATGAFVNVFAEPPSLPGPQGPLPPFPSDLLFLDDGSLLVSYTGQGMIGKIASNGAPVGPFAFGGGLVVPGQMLIAEIVPEPQTAALAALAAVVGIGLARRRKAPSRG